MWNFSCSYGRLLKTEGRQPWAALSQHIPTFFQAVGSHETEWARVPHHHPHSGIRQRVRETASEVGRGRLARISLGLHNFVYLQVSRPLCLSASPWYSLVKWQHSSGPSICLTPWIVGSNISSHSPEPMTDRVQRWLSLSAHPLLPSAAHRDNSDFQALQSWKQAANQQQQSGALLKFQGINTSQWRKKNKTSKNKRHNFQVLISDRALQITVNALWCQHIQNTTWSLEAQFDVMAGHKLNGLQGATCLRETCTSACDANWRST